MLLSARVGGTVISRAHACREVLEGTIHAHANPAVTMLLLAYGMTVSQVRMLSSGVRAQKPKLVRQAA